MKIAKQTLLIISFWFLLISNCFAKTTEYDYLDMTNVSFNEVKAKHILLYNLQDEKVVYQIGNEDKISIASLTKIMTALVAIEKNENLDAKVTVPNSAFIGINGYAEAGFKAYESVTLRDLLYGTLLPSGVEAAQSLSILTSGNIPSFVDAMNELATKIGLTNTHFSNPVGRDSEENYSTLDDLKKLLLYALKNETFKTIYTTRTYQATNGLNLNSTLVGPSTKYHLNIENIKGSKSGFTKQAGLCLSSVSEYDGIPYLLIIADSLYQNGYPNHIIDSLEIYNYFWEHYSYEKIIDNNTEVITLKVDDAKEENYVVKSNQDVSFYIDKDAKSSITYQYHGIDIIDYKVNMYEKIGDVDVVYKEQILYTFPVYLESSLHFKYTKFIVMGIGIVVLVFLSILLIIIRCKKKRRKKKW